MPAGFPDKDQDQEWEFVRWNEGAYMIKNKSSGNLLSIAGGSTADGAAAVDSARVVSPDQTWELIRIG